MTLKIFIAGEWRDGRGDPMVSRFPADGSVNAELNAASLDDVEEAIAAADAAWRAPAWRERLPHERAEVLYRVSDLIRERLDELAALQTRDNGQAPGRGPRPGGQRRRHCALLRGGLRDPGG